MAATLAFLADTYEVLESLPETGGGARYRLRHRRLNGERVVELLPIPSGGDGLKERLRMAVSELGRLGDPHFARVEDFGFTATGLAYVVMERQPGRRFPQLLEDDGPPPLELALEMACQASGALANLHRRGLLHRDITPARLALSRDAEGRPFVAWIDFGLARLVESTASGGLYIGKVRYAAPEHFGTGESSEATSAGDVYALGLVLYELFTGRFPIEGGNATSIIAGHLFRPPLSFEESDPEGRIPESLRGVLLTALAKARGERYQDAAALHQELTSLQTPEAWDLPATTVWLNRALGPSNERTATARTGTDWLGEVPAAAQEGTAGEGTAGEGTAGEGTAGEGTDTDEALSTMAWIERLLTEGDLESAAAALDRAAHTFSGHPQLEVLSRRLEATRAERLASASGSEARWVQAQTLVERARTLSGSENFQEAHELAREAVELAPEHPDAILLSSSLQALLAWRDQEDQGRRELDEAVEEIRQLLNDRRTGEAMARLQRAVARYGEVPELQRMRRVTADAFLYGDSYVDLPAPKQPAPMVVPPVTMPIQTVPSADSPPPPHAAPPHAAPHAPPHAPPHALPQAAPHFAQSTTYEEPHGLEPLAGTRREVGAVPLPSPLEDLPLAGMGVREEEGMTGAGALEESPGFPNEGNRANQISFDLTDPRTWLLLIAVVVVFLFLGMWMAGDGSEDLPETDPKPPVEDVQQRSIPIGRFLK